MKRIQSYRNESRLSYANNALVLALAVCIVGSIAGCGGGTISERDMARFALRNKPEVEEEESAPPPPAKKPAEQVASVERRPNPSVPPKQKPPAAVEAAEPDESADRSVVDEPLTDTQTAPKEPLSPEERTKKSVANIERIAAALQKHLDEKGYYPARSISTGEDENLSWRVALLPYLGYERLYAEFRLDEPWNSRHNYELLSKIPAVYQSPERFDDHTNYEFPVDSSTVFRGKGVVRTSDFEDGAKNTAMLVEVDDVAAVPWTAPREFVPDARAPNKNLGTLRGGSFFVVWGNAEVGRVPSTASQDKIRALFTHDAGEAFSSGEVDQPLFAAAARTPGPAAPAASTATATASAPTVAAPTSALATEYAQQSSDALLRRDEQLGVSYFYAAALAGPPGQPWVQQFQWVPALRRPAAVIRFGIGVQYDGARDNRSTDDDRRPTARGGTWNSLDKELTTQLVELLATHSEAHGNSSLLAQEPVSKRRGASAKQRPKSRTLDATGLFAPGVAYLTEARESALRKLAQREGIDLLVLVDWRETARGWSAGLSLVDVVRGAEVWKAPRILSAKIDRAKSNPLAANPIDDTLRDFLEFLETDCVFRDIPKQLQTRHAAARIAALAAEKDNDPLRAMVEMRLYQELGLVEATQLVKAYQTKLGDDPGLALVLGSDEAKRQIFKSLMPPVPLVANNQLQPAYPADDEDE